jgi:TetR/AcrR family transcriptional regulator, transcriptional repressor for nem operon
MGRTSDADQRLMDAALELVWSQSYGAVTIDDICKRAQVKKGSFYYYYDSKEQLAVAALERMWIEDWKPAMDAIFSASIEPLDRLKAYLGGIHRRSVETKARVGRMIGCPVASVGSEVSTQDCNICSKTRELLGRKRRYVESAMREAMANGSIEPGDPVKRTLVLASLIEGMMLQARMMNDPEVLKDLLEMGLEIIRVRQPAPSIAPALEPALPEAT